MDLKKTIAKSSSKKINPKKSSKKINPKKTIPKKTISKKTISKKTIAKKSSKKILGGYIGNETYTSNHSNNHSYKLTKSSDSTIYNKSQIIHHNHHHHSKKTPKTHSKKKNIKKTSSKKISKKKKIIGGDLGGAIVDVFNKLGKVGESIIYEQKALININKDIDNPPKPTVSGPDVVKTK